MNDNINVAAKFDADAAFSCYHLAEAASGISSLLTSIALGGDLDRQNESVARTVAHLYEHLNWFWHGNERSDRKSLDLSAKEFAAFSEFPTALYEHMVSRS